MHPTLVFSNDPIRMVMSRCQVLLKQEGATHVLPHFSQRLPLFKPNATTYNLQGRKELLCSLSALSPGGWNLQDYLTQSGPEVRLLGTHAVWRRESMYEWNLACLGGLC